MIISTEELQKILDDENLVLVDTRSFKEYSEGHVPGAIHLDLFAFHWIDTTSNGIKNFNKQTETLFSFAGINEHKKIVFYDNVSGMLAARGVWMCMYFSLSDAVMLDGGLTKWKKEDRLVEKKPNNFRPAKFEGKINSDIVAGFGYIRDNLGDLRIIDARSTGEFEGTVIRAANSGHIPNSKNIDWNQNITRDGMFKSDNELLHIYDFPLDQEIVVYCQGAYRAANSFLVMKKLGFENVKVYLGSWGEWGNHIELPVEK